MAAIPQPKAFTVRSVVEGYINGLQIEVINAKNNTERFQAVNRTLDEIRSLRDTAPPQNQREEGQMNLMVSVLESLPEQHEFKKKNCASYQNDFLNQYDPLAEDVPEDPAIRPGWTILQALCK
jgi:hypothetical protein